MSIPPTSHAIQPLALFGVPVKLDLSLSQCYWHVNCHCMYERACTMLPWPYGQLQIGPMHGPSC